VIQFPAESDGTVSAAVSGEAFVDLLLQFMRTLLMNRSIFLSAEVIRLDAADGAVGIDAIASNFISHGTAS
jgi:hypothetical protein